MKNGEEKLAIDRAPQTVPSCNNSLYPSGMITSAAIPAFTNLSHFYIWDINTLPTHCSLTKLGTNRVSVLRVQASSLCLKKFIIQSGNKI